MTKEKRRNSMKKFHRNIGNEIHEEVKHICPQCKNTFFTKRKNQICCSRDCSRKYNKSKMVDSLRKTISRLRSTGQLKMGGYRPGSGRAKTGYYHGIYCGSTYELVWLIYQIDHNKDFKRFEGVLEWNGTKYIPDFLQDGKIIELKGFESVESVARKTLVANRNGYEVIVLRKNDLKNEFDYVFYTYGLSLYGNLPLIEPLEYSDDKKIRDFVIAIDTSGSCSGELVKHFIEKTYNILRDSENFFRKVNIHIIQCDSKIQHDDVIKSREDFENYIKNVKIYGGGGTDFRPVFQYVKELVDAKAFRNLKGIIYLTDGIGIYPEKKPDYDTAFVFVDDEDGNHVVPPWAMKLVLRKEEIGEEDVF